MRRRELLASSAGLAAAAGIVGQTASDAATRDRDAGREWYLLLQYQLAKPEKVEPIATYYREVAAPALRRIGVGPVGIFTQATDTPTPSVYVLLAGRSPEVLATCTMRLLSDPEVGRSGASYLSALPDDPAYQRVESSLLLAFEGMPKLQIPAKKPRIFELRIYESHSEKAGMKKVEMFNKEEIAIFRRTGLTPVFFGQTMVGPRMPNLTYMLVFDDMPAHDRAWRAFGADADWQRLRAIPEYADRNIVSKVSNVFLKPLEGSEI
jgi:hypothetical protein